MYLSCCAVQLHGIYQRHTSWWRGDGPARNKLKKRTARSVKIGVAAVKPFMEDIVDQGCGPALWAATSPEVVEGNVNGRYVVPDKKVMEPSSQSRDEGLAKQLWVLSKEILREKLGGLPYDSVGV